MHEFFKLPCRNVQQNTLQWSIFVASQQAMRCCALNARQRIFYSLLLRLLFFQRFFLSTIFVLCGCSLHAADCNEHP